MKPRARIPNKATVIALLALRDETLARKKLEKQQPTPANRRIRCVQHENRIYSLKTQLKELVEENKELRKDLTALLNYDKTYGGENEKRRTE